MRCFRGGSKMKKSKLLTSIALCAVIVISTIFCTGNSFANKANTKAEPNNAWLADFYIRESSTDFVKATVYPDMSTFHKQEASYRNDIANVKKLIDIDITTLNSIYVDILEKAFGIIDGLFADVDYSVMKEYLQTQWKIVYTEPPKSTDAMYTTIMYAVFKYDLMYPLNGTHFTVAEGTTLDRAVVLLISTLLEDPVGEEIDTLEKYAILNIKKSLVKNGYLESVNDPVTNDELLLLYKIMIAENEGFKIANHKVATLTDEDKDFIHSSYASAVIKLNFDVSIAPNKTGAALKSEKADALELLILRSMIEARNGTVTGSENVTELLQIASKLGCFKLEHEFYSDIYVYDVYLIYNCKEVWMTPFTYAAELGVDKLKNVSISINGNKAENSRSLRVKVNGDISNIVVKLKYDDGIVKDTAEYVFRLHNGTRELPKVEAPTPQPPKNDSGYTGPNLLKPNNPASKFELMDPNAVIIDPFKVGIGGSHSLPLPPSILGNINPSNTQGAEVQEHSDNVSSKDTLNKKAVTTVLSIAAIAVLIIVLVVIVLKKNNKINFNIETFKKNKKDE